jgi:hypothetical protein
MATDHLKPISFSADNNTQKLTNRSFWVLAKLQLRPDYSAETQLTLSQSICHCPDKSAPIYKIIKKWKKFFSQK